MLINWIRIEQIKTGQKLLALTGYSLFTQGPSFSWPTDVSNHPISSCLQRTTTSCRHCNDLQQQVICKYILDTTLGQITDQGTVHWWLVSSSLRGQCIFRWRMTVIFNKKLSCRRETVRSFVSLNILTSHSRSFEMRLLSRACIRPY